MYCRTIVWVLGLTMVGDIVTGCSLRSCCHRLTHRLEELTDAVNEIKYLRSTVVTMTTENDKLKQSLDEIKQGQEKTDTNVHLIHATADQILNKTTAVESIAKAVEEGVEVVGENVKAVEADVDVLIENDNRTLTEIRRQFVVIETLLTPASCLTSSIYGRQTLRGGEEMFCDGGWTVFQRRLDGSVNFALPWANYKDGFGDLSAEFWLGLDKIHNLTKNRGCKLRIDLWDFEDDHRHAIYSDFAVEGEDDLYRLHFGGYSGTAGNSFSKDQDMNGMAFSTPDRDNDLSASLSCAISAGGWWMNACTHGPLNAPWGVSTGRWSGIFWDTWKGPSETLKAVVMKLRCD